MKYVFFCYFNNVTRPLQYRHFLWSPQCSYVLTGLTVFDDFVLRNICTFSPDFRVSIIYDKNKNLFWDFPNNFVAKSTLCLFLVCLFFHVPLSHLTYPSPTLSLSFLSFSPCPSLPFLLFLFSLFHAHRSAMATERSDKVRYIIYPCFTLYLLKMIQFLEDWIYVLQFWAMSLLNHAADLKNRYNMLVFRGHVSTSIASTKVVCIFFSDNATQVCNFDFLPFFRGVLYARSELSQNYVVFSILERPRLVLHPRSVS